VIIRKILFAACFFIINTSAIAQEVVAPIRFNPFLEKSNSQKIFRKTTTTLSLPFFEDFTDNNPFPNPTKWVEAEVYINNTMPFNPITRGVATFDGLNAKGGPYDSSYNTNLVYADSLTSQAFDLTVHSPADSLYLSFFFQPQGNGFAPETQDSLMLFMKKYNGDWKKVWAVDGGLIQPFIQVLIPVVDSYYFHNDFQFRFVNKASININDDDWNLDYIYFNSGRNLYDTLVNDVATSIEPSNLLNDFTAMPYRQFVNHQSQLLNVNHYFYVKNNYGNNTSINLGYTAKETQTNTPLFSSALSNDVMIPYALNQYSFALFPISFTAFGLNDKVVFEQSYFINNNLNPNEPKDNDTITFQQVFDNYLSYDDGTAEKSYFLNQFSTTPAKTAIDFYLNEPDTLRGVAIYFARQVPIPSNKFFSIVVYQSIALNGGFDTVYYQQDLFYPMYDSINHFWIYRLDTALALPAGTFYIGTVQPAMSGCDSIYFGLDVNRIGANHLYYNVLNYWNYSSVSGAIMIRPLLGQPVIGTAIKDVAQHQSLSWSLTPNPANDFITVDGDFKNILNHLEILDATGRLVVDEDFSLHHLVNIANLEPGFYFARIVQNNQYTQLIKFIKQ
jgi:hypothetical protein